MANQQALSWHGETLSPKASIFASHNLLAVYLLAIGLNSCVFYLFPSGYYDHNVNLAFSLTCFGLLPFTRVEKLFSPLVHLASLLCVMLVSYVALYSGGGQFHGTGLAQLGVFASVDVARAPRGTPVDWFCPACDFWPLPCDGSRLDQWACLGQSTGGALGRDAKRFGAGQFDAVCGLV